MWQIIAYTLSIIHTQGLFVVTQIAAVNLDTGKMTFAKVWVTSSVWKELFLFNSLLHQLSFCVIINGGILSQRIEATFHTKGSRLVIMMSRYHLFNLAYADTFDCMQTNAADEYIHNHKITKVHSMCILRVFILVKCLLQNSSWHIAETEKIFLE